MAGPSLDDIVALFDRRRAAWLAEDLEAYLDCFADDLELTVPGRDVVRGRAAYEAVVVRSTAWARPARFDLHHLAVTPGGEVLAEWTIAVERRDTGAEVTWRGMSACSLDGERIRHWREYWDPAALG